MNETVVLKNLHIKDGKNTLVSNTSLTIEKGDIYGLVGESGSGKTLTAKAIINLLPEGLKFTADEINVAGKNILKASQNEVTMYIGKNAGYIPQNTVFFLHPMIKIKNQIADGYVHHMKRSKAEGLKISLQLLDMVGFENPESILNFYPWQLSGGMRQRVNIAMALMNNPAFIIADEPTTALDSTVQKQVMELFKKINGDTGISILLISHDLSLIKHYCLKIGVMYAGQIVESGYSKDIFENPKHPYTQLLIKMMPTMNIKKNEPIPEIKGFVPEKGRDSQGCLFKERCPFAMDVCGISVKEHNDSGHYYRCNLY
ncbi:ABC transporter ATP-binding protein [Sedimentibacter hydroxybenzoicus DSM 7310]|uniref:ABC transporter ATP-binding protein n=1 Tax=Sedimentibacter hydroxybenzoicus DSM 7310 TaxID=1123245 RepID=A0A974BHT0_SEDHY|nr:ABC transporter ATP-binding protein [Sedimentibacter hydroxybenzoicus]NYB73363.1 ABC transporter ATP-binding protein [Sedimentibacter hydroxybenzoicus DSM 7310]